MTSSDIRDQLQKLGIAHDFSLHPSKAVCNNCGAEIEYDHPNIISVFDSTTTEVLYCPNCGPHDADSIDGVKNVRT